jgi:amino acid adenylation domain-containing protein
MPGFDRGWLHYGHKIRRTSTAGTSSTANLVALQTDKNTTTADELLFFSATIPAMESDQKIWSLSRNSKDSLLKALQLRDFRLTDQTGHLDYRIAILAKPDDELPDRCDQAISLIRETSLDQLNVGNRIFFGHCPGSCRHGKLALVFPGYGAHYDDMFSDLYHTFPLVKDWFGNLSPAHRKAFQANPFLFGNKSQSKTPPTSGELVTAILVMNLAMSKLIKALGICGDCAVGHSHGENAALAAAGMLVDPGALFDTVRQVIAQAAGRTAPRQMLAMRSIPGLDLKPPLHLALDNCPSQIIASGPAEAIAGQEQQLKDAGELCFRLDQVTEPVHTPDFPLPIDALTTLYRPIETHTPAFPVYCCQTTRPFPDQHKPVVDLLARQWREPVRFRETIKAMYQDGVRTFLEVGPAGRLSGFIRDTLRGSDAVTLATDLEKQAAKSQIQLVVGRLFSMGYPVNPSHAMLAPGSTDADAPCTNGTEKLSVAKKPANGSDLQNEIVHLVGELLQISAPNLIDPDQGFFTLGLSSVDVVSLADRLSERLGETIAPIAAFDHPTPRLLARFLGNPNGSRTADSPEPFIAIRSDDAVAIIGMACRFPGGAGTPNQFWDLLSQGVDAIAPAPTDRWDSRRYHSAPQHDAAYHGGFLSDVKTFDAAFFNLAPREAITLDPQQRLLLEVTWEALENACIPPSQLNGSPTGVFVGISSRDYAERLSPAERIRQTGYMATGNAPSAAAGRISHFLGTTGPSLAVDTACSSSLVAVDLACRSLADGDSRLAIAGGVNLILSPELTTYLASANALAADSRCKTFDARADGYVRSEGCGMLILKNLSEAVNQGDPILAVIRGTATSHTGHSSGLTVPNSRSQEKLIRLALSRSSLATEDIGYVEAHGTGTQLGDPIELNGLAAVFSNLTSLPIASVKTNIGHLEAAAGVAGLIKLVLQLQHGQIAPHLHLDTPNPALDWDQTPFTVPRELVPWPERGGTRAGAVSSFGISGTNAHVVVSQAPKPARDTFLKDLDPHHILTLSARDGAALSTLAKHYQRTLAELPDSRLADFCYTSNVGRQHFPQRISVTGRTAREMADLLADSSFSTADPFMGCVFLFSGQGTQYPGMGRDLYRTEPVFRNTFDQCAQYFEPDLKQPLHKAVFDRDFDELDQTGYSQPAIFSLQMGLSALWADWGIEAAAVIGHSIGEYAAAVTAKVLSLTDAARVVGARARLMQSLPRTGTDRGAMLALRMSEAAANQLLLETSVELSLAAVNGPESIVLSGRKTAVDKMQTLATRRGIDCQMLSVSHAFHSYLMTPVLDEFGDVLQSVNLQLPAIPFASTMSGRIEDEALLNPAFWTKQISATVRFADGLTAVKETNLNCHLEIGPGITLTALSQEMIPSPGIRRLSSLHPKRDACQQIRRTLAALYADRAPVDWNAFHRGRTRQRLTLPNYPFQRQTFWIDDHDKGKTDTQRTNWTEPEAGQATPTLEAAVSTQTDPDPLRATLYDDPEALSAHLHEQVCFTIGLAKDASFDPASSFAELGMDSMMAAMLAYQVGNALDVSLAVPAVARCQSFSDFVSMVSQALRGISEKTLAGRNNLDSDGPTELSEGQRALWYLWRLAPESTAYNQSLPIVFSEDPGAEKLSAAWRMLIRRHEMLRCCFPILDGEPVAKIMPEDSDIDYQTIEIGGHPDEISGQLAEHHDQPFDIASTPPVRVRSFHGHQGVTFLITMHHIICDGWSLEILYRELTQLLSGQTLGADMNRYRDYVAWESAMLSGPAGDALAGYWRKTLYPPLPITELPTDFVRPALQTYAGALHTRELEPALMLGLKGLARTHHTTLFTVTLAGWFLLLYRYGGLDDLLVSTPTAGRSQSGQTGIVGYFVNPVLIRAGIDPACSVTEFLELIRDRSQEAVGHADYPFPMLAQLVNPVRDPGRSPMTDISFNYVADLETIRPDTAIECAIFDIPQAAGKFDLTANIIEHPNNPRVSLGYNRDLFRPQTIAQMAIDLEAILSEFIKSPEQALGTLPLSGTSGQPLSTPPISEPGRAPTVIQLLHQQAQKTPGLPAVYASDQSLTYQELDRKSDALASVLRQDHPDPTSAIALIAPRNAAAVIALFGILKAGAPYLAIDPDTPPDLVRRMLNECGVRTVIGDTGTVSATARDLKTIELEHLPSQLTLQPPPPGTTAGHNDLAYIMYTSGSSGVPKGVEVSHKALSNYVEGIQRVLDIGPGDAFAHVSTLAADLGNTALFPTLAAGGCVHMLDREQITDINAIADYFSTHRIDYLKIVPSHLETLLQTGLPSAPLPGKKLILGGESAPPVLINKVRDLAPNLIIINHYGPTETTIGVLTHTLTPETPYQGPEDLPLGKPLPGCSVYLVNQDLKPVPRGAVGEVVIGGRCLSRGYRNQEGPTRTSFIEWNPTDNPGAGGELMRSYRTGDLARMDLDGRLHYIGRADRQCKVRGYRVEPRHIEQLILAFGEIDQCRVLLVDRGLTACIVSSQKTQFNELRSFLASRLPGYMVPDRFVTMRELPLTANGKVNNDALQAVLRSDQGAQGAGQMRDLTELKLTRIWRDILDQDVSGIRQDFFQLGGHSLLAVRLAWQIEKEFAVSVPLAAFYSHATIEAQAELIRQSDHVQDPILVGLAQAVDSEPVILLPGAGGNTFYLAGLAAQLGTRHQVWGLQAPGQYGSDTRLLTSVPAIASYFLEVLEDAGMEGPYRLIGHSFGALVAFEMASQLCRRKESIAMVGVIDNPPPENDQDSAYQGWDHTDWLMHIAIRMQKIFDAEIILDADALREMTDDEQNQWFAKSLVAAGLLPKGTSADYLSRFIELYRSNAIAGMNYRPGRLPTDVPLAVFCAETQDPELAGPTSVADSTVGWSRYTEGVPYVGRVPGTHITMLQEPNVNALAGQITAMLAGAPRNV